MGISRWWQSLNTTQKILVVGVAAGIVIPTTGWAVSCANSGQEVSQEVNIFNLPERVTKGESVEVATGPLGTECEVFFTLPDGRTIKVSSKRDSVTGRQVIRIPATREGEEDIVIICEFQGELFAIRDTLLVEG